VTAPDGDWRLVREGARPGPVQMALDEVAAETAAAGGPRTVRVYRWEPDCLSLGFLQDPDTVDWAACDRLGIDVTRRRTGGGGIYHDAVGDISYSIAVPADEVPGDLTDCYRLLCAPILDAFDRLGLDAGFAEGERPALYDPACYLRAVDPAHDLTVGGRKVAGNAQYRRRGSILQHGSLTYAAAPDRHLAAFADPPVDATAFRDRVVGMNEAAGGDLDRADAVAAVERALADWAGATPGSWSADELAAARERAAAKYADGSWLRRTPGG